MVTLLWVLWERVLRKESIWQLRQTVANQMKRGGLGSLVRTGN